MTSDAMRMLTALLGAVPNINQREKDVILRICARPETFTGDSAQRASAAQEQELRLVTAADAARLLGISKRMIWHLARQGRLRRTRLGRRCVRFRFRDLCKMVDGLTEVPTAAADARNEDSF